MQKKILQNYIKSKWSHLGFQKYIKNLGWIFFAKGGSMLISLLATAYTVRNLGPTNYGELSYAISFVSIFSFITLSGIDQVLYRDIIKYPEEKNHLMGSAFGLRFIGGIIAIVLCLTFAFFLSEHNLSIFLILLISLGYIFQPFQIINYEFQAQVKSKYPSLASMFIVLILNILKILVVALNQGILYLALIFLLESILYALFYLYIYRTKIHENIFLWKFNTHLAKKMIIDSWPIIISSAFILIYARIDQVFIRHMVDTNSVGLYDAAVRISEAWVLIPSIIVSSLFPAIINAKITSESQYENRLGKLGLLLFVLSGCIALCITLLAPFIIYFLYGAEFSPASLILQIYIWASVATSLSILTNAYLIAENHRKVLFSSSFLIMVSNLILNLVLIPSFGIAGAAWATVISYSLGPLCLVCFSTTRSQIVRILKNIFVY